MENSLLVVEDKTALQAFTDGSGLDVIIQQAKDTVQSFEHDLSTATSRKRTASLARKVASLKTNLDEKGKGLGEGWSKKLNLLNSSRKKMRDELDLLKIEARKPLTDWENDEKERINAIQSRLAHFSVLSSSTHPETSEPLSSNVLKGNLLALEAIIIDESFDEFISTAEAKQHQATVALKEHIQAREKFEADQIELEQLRKQAEEQRIKDHENQIAAEAVAKVEREKKEATEREQRAVEQAKQAEKDKIAAAALAEESRIKAEAKAKADQAEAVERAKQRELDRQAQAKAEEERQAREREANIKHVSGIMKAAKEALMLNPGINEELARSIVISIKRGEIPAVSMTF